MRSICLLSPFLEQLLRPRQRKPTQGKLTQGKRLGGNDAGKTGSGETTQETIRETDTGEKLTQGK